MGQRLTFSMLEARGADQVPLRSCYPKFQHASLGQAEAHLRSLLRAPYVKNAGSLQAYGPCRYCGFFHVGHSAEATCRS